MNLNYLATKEKYYSEIRYKHKKLLPLIIDTVISKHNQMQFIDMTDSELFEHLRRIEENFGGTKRAPKLAYIEYLKVRLYTFPKFKETHVINKLMKTMRETDSLLTYAESLYVSLAILGGEYDIEQAS